VPEAARDEVTTAYTALLPAGRPVALSALKDDGVSGLLDQVVAALPEGPRYYPPDQITDVFVRDIAAELIREQLMLQLEDEIPYGTAVRVQEFKERPDGTNYINADIYVDRENHKGMIIGKKGAQLRSIGAAAREEIEKLVDGPVYLDLYVVVEPNWRRDERLLRQFGYDSRNQ
jgi:GTP-binding protein Era